MLLYCWVTACSVVDGVKMTGAAAAGEAGSACQWHEKKAGQAAAAVLPACRGTSSLTPN